MQLKGNSYLKLPKYLDLNMPNILNINSGLNLHLGLPFTFCRELIDQRILLLPHTKNGSM